MFRRPGSTIRILSCMSVCTVLPFVRERKTNFSTQQPKRKEANDPITSSSIVSVAVVLVLAFVLFYLLIVWEERDGWVLFLSFLHFLSSFSFRTSLFFLPPSFSITTSDRNFAERYDVSL